MSKKYWVFGVFLAIVVVVCFADLAWNGRHARAGAREQSLQVYGCSNTLRDKEIFESVKKNGNHDGETLDDVATESDLGLHVCIVVDPNSGRRFLVAFDGTGYQGHVAVAISDDNPLPSK